MRYCKQGTCLCVEFRAADIRVDANMCHCEHALHQHNLTGSTDEGSDDSEVIKRFITSGSLTDRAIREATREELQHHGIDTRRWIRD